MTGLNDVSRRDFLRISYTAGLGLLISLYLPRCSRENLFSSSPTTTPTLPPPLDGPDAFTPGLFVTIGHDGKITITVHRSEMGQGVRTALPMILAEELDADWTSIHVAQADADSAYGDQVTGGSVSISTSYLALRLAGAVARDLLISAAAQVWGIGKEKCSSQNGKVIRLDKKGELPYGYLVPLAATLPVPEPGSVSLKPPEKFRIIGTAVHGMDDPDIITGKAIYGSDVTLPGMLYAVVAHSPVIGGSITAYDDSKAKQMPGVRGIHPLDSGIAVVAENTWSAIKGRQALILTYDDGPNASFDSEAEEQKLIQRLTIQPDPDELVAYYVMPYFSHAPMEPMNCVADVKNDSCDIWVSTQDPVGFKYQAAAIAGTRDVRLHVPLLGGGFGRRLGIGPINYVGEAIQLSKLVGAPIKLFWTREEDIQHEYYHPLSVTRVRAKLNDLNSLVATRNEAGGIPTGAWRSVTNVPEAFAHECFLDEFAHATGQDVVELHRQILYGRALDVVNMAAEKAGWGKPPAVGRGFGFAYHATWGVTHVAQVAEVSIDEKDDVHVHRVVCAVDCGVVINPNTVKAQMEGGIIFGLTAALKASVRVEHGRVKQSNFHDYPLFRLDEIPEIEVHILPNDALPSGIGEMANPVIMPAVANAIFAASGKRVRRVPIRAADIQMA